jgi:hypothetical protein
MQVCALWLKALEVHALKTIAPMPVRFVSAKIRVKILLPTDTDKIFLAV